MHLHIHYGWILALHRMCIHTSGEITTARDGFESGIISVLFSCVVMMCLCLCWCLWVLICQQKYRMALVHILRDKKKISSIVESSQQQIMTPTTTAKIILSITRHSIKIKMTIGIYFLSVLPNLIMALHKYWITYDSQSLSVSALLTQCTHSEIRIKNEPENNNSVCQPILKVFDEIIEQKPNEEVFNTTM